MRAPIAPTVAFLLQLGVITAAAIGATAGATRGAATRADAEPVTATDPGAATRAVTPTDPGAATRAATAAGATARATAAAVAPVSAAPGGFAPREENLELVAPDGVILRGVLMLPEGAPRPPVAILLHDVTRDRDSLAIVSEALTRRGVACAVFNLRGHASSSTTTGGMLYILSARPARDLHLVTGDQTLVLELLQRRADVDSSRVALLGIGHGALIAAEAGARGPRVKALVLVDPVAPLADFRPDHDLGLFDRRPVLFITSATPERRNRAKDLAEFGSGERTVWPGESFDSVHALLQPGSEALPLTVEWLATRLGLPAAAP